MRDMFAIAKFVVWKLSSFEWADMQARAWIEGHAVVNI